VLARLRRARQLRLSVLSATANVCENQKDGYNLAHGRIRWGVDVSSDRLRQRARCSSCGKKGATIQHPGWGGNNVGFLRFPT
jgi:hypothetical protein